MVHAERVRPMAVRALLAQLARERARSADVGVASPPSTCTLRMTSSKNSKRSTAPAMKPPIPAAPTNSIGALVTVSTVIGASGRKSASSSDHARRVTASAYAAWSRQIAT